MASDQNTPNSLKLLLLTTVVTIAVTIALVMLYLSARQESFAKTHPYSLLIQVQTKESGVLNVAYDYGYGFNAGHQQTFELVNSGTQTINFTISSWKALRSLRIGSDSPIDVNTVIISQNDFKFVAIESPVRINQDSPVMITDINHQLLELR